MEGRPSGGVREVWRRPTDNIARDRRLARREWRPVRSGPVACKRVLASRQLGSAGRKGQAASRACGETNWIAADSPRPQLNSAPAPNGRRWVFQAPRPPRPCDRRPRPPLFARPLRADLHRPETSKRRELDGRLLPPIEGRPPTKESLGRPLCLRAPLAIGAAAAAATTDRPPEGSVFRREWYSRHQPLARQAGRMDARLECNWFWPGGRAGGLAGWRAGGENELGATKARGAFPNIMQRHTIRPAAVSAARFAFLFAQPPSSNPIPFIALAAARTIVPFALNCACELAGRLETPAERAAVGKCRGLRGRAGAALRADAPTGRPASWPARLLWLPSNPTGAASSLWAAASSRPGGSSNNNGCRRANWAHFGLIDGRAANSRPAAPRARHLKPKRARRTISAARRLVSNWNRSQSRGSAAAVVRVIPARARTRSTLRSAAFGQAPQYRAHRPLDLAR